MGVELVDAMISRKAWDYLEMRRRRMGGHASIADMLDEMLYQVEDNETVAEPRELPDVLDTVVASARGFVEADGPMEWEELLTAARGKAISRFGPNSEAGSFRIGQLDDEGHALFALLDLIHVTGDALDVVYRDKDSEEPHDYWRVVLV